MNLPDPIKLLGDYIAIDSSHPGGETEKTASFLMSVLNDYGVKAEKYYSDNPDAAIKPNLLAVLPGQTKSPIILLHHMDVVRAEAYQFEPIIQGGAIFGRGAIDDKGLGIIHLLAFLRLLEDIKEHGVRLRRPVCFLAVCDEEIAGESGAATMVAKLFEEPLFGNDFEEPPIVLDEGGYWIRGLFRKPILNVAVTEKRQMVLKINFYGQSGHGALPPKPNDNAKLKAAKAEVALAAAERPLLLNPVTKETMRLIRKLKMGGLPLPVGAIAALASRTNSKIYALTHDTIVSTTEESDADINVVPAVVTKYLDIRLLPTTDPTKVFGFVVEVLIENAGLAFGEDFDLKIVRRPISSAVSSSGKVVDVIREKVRLYDADTEVVVAQCPGFTDSRWFRAVGCEAYGIFPVPLSENELDNIHGKQERVSIDGFQRGINLMYEIVANLSK